MIHGTAYFDLKNQLVKIDNENAAEGTSLSLTYCKNWIGYNPTTTLTLANE